MMANKSLGSAFLLVPSSLMIAVFFMVPFALVLLASVAVPTPDGDYRYGFDLQHFERFATWFYIERALFSTAMAILVALISLFIAFPFSYLLIGFSQRSKTLWLIYILAQLSLSEVLIAFSWQILLSRTAGISNLLVWVGLAEKPFAMLPSAGAVIAALVYLALPFAILLLYPALSRIDRSLIEAARTLGASPIRAFFNIVLPVTKSAIVASGVTIFVLTLGAIIVPQVLGRPAHWTLSVMITDQAISNFNLPFASALAVVLLALSGLVIVAVMRFGRESR